MQRMSAMRRLGFAVLLALPLIGCPQLQSDNWYFVGDGGMGATSSDASTVGDSNAPEDGTTRIDANASTDGTTSPD